MINRFFNSPNRTKLFSLLTGILLWFFVGAQNPETEMTYRGVEIKVVTLNSQLEDGVTVIDMGRETTDVTLKGSKSVLGRITAADLYAYVEVDASSGPGDFMLPVHITKPLDSVIVTGKNPGSITVQLDRIARRTVPVRASVTNLLGDEYLVGEPVLNVQTIDLRGPATELAGVAEARVEVKLSEQNMAEPTINLLVKLIDQSGEAMENNHIEMPEQAVSLTPVVSKRVRLPLTVDFLNRPEGWLTEDFGWEISPEQVTLLIPVSELRTQGALKIGTVDLVEHPENGRVTLPMVTPYPIEGGEDEAEVLLRFGDLRSFQWALQRLEFDNTPPGLSVEVLSTMPINVTMRGTAGAVRAYSGSGLRGIVDLRGLSAGETATLPVRIVTGDVAIGPMQHLTVTVRMSDILADSEGGEQLSGDLDGAASSDGAEEAE
ncbi:MAG: hypothetical protein GXX99_02370 [Clostridiales bacterium]|nr:hypothetical protein [Clostridiales bacterium]